jgi:hypothetical protein
MLASIIRIALFAGLLFGGYKLYPKIKPSLEPIIGNPQVLGVELATPIINTINQALPDNLQLPVPKQTNQPSETTDANGKVKGTNVSNPVSNIANTVIEQVKVKAGELAQEQIDSAKKEAGKAFCQVLIEKVKSECNF